MQKGDKMKIKIVLILTTILLLASCNANTAQETGNIISGTLDTSLDTTPPVITLVSDKVEIDEGQSFAAMKYVKATDDTDGNLDNKIKIKQNNLKNIPGTYTIIYEVSDVAKNKSQATLTVVVKIVYTKAEINAASAIKALKGILKNPESAQIHSIKARDYKDTGAFSYTFQIDISAQNGFGGMNREYYYIDVYLDGTVDSRTFTDPVQKNASTLWGISPGENQVDVERVIAYLK